METELYFNGQRVTEKELNELMDGAQVEMERREREVAVYFGVSHATASAVCYLRTRSRWTQEKEDELIERDKKGNPIPLSTVLSGEF